MGERWLIWIQFHLHILLYRLLRKAKTFSTKLNKTFFWLLSTIYIFWFVLIFWFLSCVKLLIIGGRALFLLVYALRIKLVSCSADFNFAFISIYQPKTLCYSLLILCRNILKEARCHERWRYLKCTRERSQRRRVYLLLLTSIFMKK